MTAPQSADRDAAPVFLATTALESAWDTSGKIVFLSEACRRYSRASKWAGLDAETLPDLWDDPRRRADAYRTVNGLYERTLPRLGSRLNDIHGESHDERYWRLIVGNWLYYYLSVLFDRHAHVAHALERFPALTTVVLSEKCDVIPNDTREFMQWILTDSYNLQLYSRILEAIGKDGFPRVEIHQEVKPTVWGPVRTGWAASARSSARGLLTGLLARAGRGRVVLHQSYFPREVELCLCVRSKGAVLPSFVLDEPVGGLQQDAAVREKLCDLLQPPLDSFEDTLAKLLPRDVPYCFVESYGAIGRASRRFPASPHAIFSANSWLYHESFKQWAGRCSEEGTQLLVAQHGGGHFGVGTYFPQEDHELRIADRYYTWGWLPPEHFRAVPMPATFLADRKQMPADNRRTGVLYVATAEERYLHSLQHLTGNFVRYLEWQARFLKEVPLSIRQLIRARLYVADFGWDMAERWGDLAPEVPIETVSRPFLESLEDCRLFVTDHLGTTFVEAMAANKPTLLFFDLESNPIRPEALSLFDELQRTGILHTSPESAALATAIAYPDVETWWNSPARQSARRSFCERHGRTTADPVGDWSEEFRSVLHPK